MNSPAKLNIIKAIVLIFFLVSVKCTSYHDQGSAEEKAMTKDSLAHSRSGPPVTVDGTARNGKAGAVLVTDKAEVYYIDGRQAWEPIVEEGRRITVSGELIETDYIEEEIQEMDSMSKKGSLNKQKLIIKAKYSVLPGDNSAQ